MIFSPLAFAGMVLHQTEGYVHEWWNYLLKEAFFAPMYMILLWISFTVINNPGFLAALGEGGTRDSSDNLLATSLQAGDNGTTGNGTAAEKNAGVLLDFMIVSALLIATLIVAEKMGVAGASGAMNFAKGAQGAIQGGAMFAVGSGFNNTVGKAVRTWKEKGVSAGLYGRASGFDEHGKAVGWASKWTARAQVAIADNLASGYNKKLDFEAKYREAAKHEFHDDPERIAQQAIDIGMGSKNSTEQQGFEQDWDKMSTKQKANVMLHMKAKGGEGNRMFSRLFTEHGHGRNTDQEIREIIRQTKQGNEFFDDELNKILERGNADELQAWLSNKDRTQGQIISALEAVKDAGRNKLKAVTPAGDALRDALTRGLRNKGGGEATFVGIARNDLIDDDIKKLSGSAAQEIASLNDIVKIMRDNPAAKNDAILVDKLKHLAGRIDSDDMRETVRQANMIHGNLTVATDMILDAYKTKFADDSSTAAVMHQTNGARGVKVSQESIAAKEAIIEDGQRFGVNIDSTYKR